MSLTIAKWGNSWAVRLPKPFVDELHWDENTEITPSIVDGKLLLERLERPVETEYRLEDLIAGISAENLHAEISTGDAVGREIW